MTNLRQGRGLRPGLPGVRPISVAAAAVVCAGLWLPGAFAAAPLTHTRRPLPTALHTSRVADTASHGSGKHSKGSSKGKAGTRSTGAPAAEAGPQKRGKRGKGRREQAEPAEMPIPMYRAHHGAATQAHGQGLVARSGHSSKHSRWNASESAPLVSTARDGKRHAQLAGTHRQPPAAIGRQAHIAVADAPRYTPPPKHEPREADSGSANAAPVVASNRSAAYAEGVSHPDDDERLPRDRAVMGEDAPTSPASVARLTAAPPSAPLAAPSAQTTVVQGFGSEIAVPSPAPAERPGGTRRRPHPANWQPESLVTAPVPLEEREAITYAAVSPAVLPEIYDHNGRLLMPAPLKGSHDVLVHQNLMANSDGLDRIYDDADLERMRAAHLLVSFPVSESLRVNEDLPLNRRVARPWTVMFAADIGHAFFQRFHQPLQVNSAVRTVRYQARLQLVNGNAAAISGDAASPHLTGQAIDFGKRGLSQAEMAWMRGYLLPMMQSGKIDVEEEFQQACFHISVYRNYASGRRTAREYAQVHAVNSEAVSAEISGSR